MVGYMKRFDPIFPLAAELVHSVRDELRGGIVRCVAGPNALYIREVADVLRADEVPAAAQASHQELRAARIRAAIGEVGPDHQLAFDEKFELYSEHETIELSFPSPFLKHAPARLWRRRDLDGTTVEETHTGSYAEAFR